ncbi:UNVERIFIED_CONTAM: hypothetical protein FKN15_012289 [Acipenser sinensis]
MVLPGSPSFSPHHAGVKLEAVMEQLQRQQQARLEMEQRERNERHVREAHIRYAQQVAAQQAAARASGNQLPSGLLHRGLSALVVGGQRASDQSSMDSEADEERARGSGDEEEEEEEEEEEMERDDELEEGSEVEEEEGSGGGAVGLEYLRKQTLALQTAHRLLPATHPSPPGPPPPIVEVKQEPDEESHSPGEQTSGSPSGQPDWGYDEQFKQVRAEGKLQVETLKGNDAEGGLYSLFSARSDPRGIEHGVAWKPFVLPPPRRSQAGGGNGAAPEAAASPSGDGAARAKRAARPRSPHQVRPAGSSSAGCSKGLGEPASFGTPAQGPVCAGGGGPESLRSEQHGLGGGRGEGPRVWGRGGGSGDEEEEMERDDELEEGSEVEEEEGSGGGAVGLEYLRKQTLALQTAHRLLPATHPSPPGPPPPIVEVKQEPDEESHSPGEQTSGSPSGQPDWGYDEQFKQVRAGALLSLLQAL